MEMLDEFLLGDVADEADVSPGSLQRMVAVEGAEIAGIPGASEQRGEMTGLPSERLEYTGKLLGEEEETAVGGRILVAQGLDEAVGGEAGGGYAAIDPRGVDFREETRDLAPAWTFAGLAGFADEHDKEIQAVACGLDHAVRGGPDYIAESGEELQQNGGRVGFGVGGNGADDTAGEAVICGGSKCGPGWGSGRVWGSRLFVVIVDKILRGILGAAIDCRIFKEILEGLRLGLRRGVRQQLWSTA
jgi:hypothetical protein